MNNGDSVLIAGLECIIEGDDPKRAAIAYAALNLVRVLAPIWVHHVKVPISKREHVWERVPRAHGEVFGNREELADHLADLLSQLKHHLA